MNHAPANLPHILRQAIAAITERLPKFIREAVFSADPHREHAMHAQRVRTLQRIISALLGRVDLATGIFARITSHKVLVDFTIADLVRATGLARSTVEDCLAFLRKVGILLSESQGIKIMRFSNSTAVIAGSCHRQFSPYFWRGMGLEEEFSEAQAQRLARPIERAGKIVGLSGVHKGHALPVPPQRQIQERKVHESSSALMESIRKANEARLRAQNEKD